MNVESRTEERDRLQRRLAEMDEEERAEQRRRLAAAAAARAAAMSAAAPALKRAEARRLLAIVYVARAYAPLHRSLSLVLGCCIACCVVVLLVRVFVYSGAELTAVAFVLAAFTVAVWITSSVFGCIENREVWELSRAPTERFMDKKDQ